MIHSIATVIHYIANALVRIVNITTCNGIVAATEGLSAAVVELHRHRMELQLQIKVSRNRIRQLLQLK
jgi:hypothetical protein